MRKSRLRLGFDDDEEKESNSIINESKDRKEHFD